MFAAAKAELPKESLVRFGLESAARFALFLQRVLAAKYPEVFSVTLSTVLSLGFTGVSISTAVSNQNVFLVLFGVLFA